MYNIRHRTRPTQMTHTVTLTEVWCAVTDESSTSDQHNRSQIFIFREYLFLLRRYTTDAFERIIQYRKVLYNLKLLFVEVSHSSLLAKMPALPYCSENQSNRSTDGNFSHGVQPALGCSSRGHRIGWLDCGSEQRARHPTIRCRTGRTSETRSGGTARHRRRWRYRRLFHSIWSWRLLADQC